jgi:hypothetical protein
VTQPQSMDCVLGFHLNPLTCGVAKFNALLARELGVPMLGFATADARSFARPCLSVKASEFAAKDVAAMWQFLDATESHQALRVFLHEYGDTDIERRMVQQAAVVYAGNSEIIAQLRGIRPDAVEVWCPGTLIDVQRFTPGEITVFSFGMAHKVSAGYYRQLHAMLERTGKTYCLYLSTALHEGTSFDGSFTDAYDELRRIFPNIYFLGFLTDAALYNYMAGTTFVAAFFQRGLRANNTTVNAAMESGAVVLTNLDAYSPSWIAHGQNVLDIRQMQDLPTDPAMLARIGAEAQDTAQQRVAWSQLMRVLATTPAPSLPLATPFASPNFRDVR